MPNPPSGFLEHVRATQKAPPAIPKKVVAAPKTEIVRRKRNVTLEPWMINTASKAFEAGGTYESVSALLNVTKDRLSGWLAASEAEGCEDDLLLEFGHACRTSRWSLVAELRGIVKAHSYTDGKIAMQLLQAYDPEMTPVKKIDAKVSVTAAPEPEAFANLDADEIRLYRQMEKKKLGTGR